MTRADLLKIYGTNAEISELFRSFRVRITASAIQQWPLHEEIPELRAMQLQKHVKRLRTVGRKRA